MLRQGVGSRSLAVDVSTSYRAAHVESSLREWLASLEVSDWLTEFSASPADLRDLLEYARRPGVRLLADLLEGEAFSIPIAADPKRRRLRDDNHALR